MISFKRHLITITTSLLLFSFNSFAQGFYFDANVGYALPIGGAPWLYNHEGYSDYINYEFTDSYENVNVSIGGGVNFGLHAGYLLNEFIGFDLGFNYLAGTKVTGEMVDHFRTEDWQTGNVIEFKNEGTISYHSNMFRITPTVFFTKKMEKFSPFVKLGMEIGFGNVHLNEDYNSNHPTEPNFHNTYKTEYQQGATIGFYSGIGGQFHLNEKWGITGEFHFTASSYTPKYSTLVERKMNGEDQLPMMDKAQKETKFVKRVTTGTNHPYNPDEASEDAQFNFANNAVGLKFGVRYTL